MKNEAKVNKKEEGQGHEEKNQKNIGWEGVVSFVIYSKRPLRDVLLSHQVLEEPIHQPQVLLCNLNALRRKGKKRNTNTRVEWSGVRNVSRR